MATTQQVRNQKQGQWSSIFPNEQVTETQSTLFVKKLLAVAVSSISYLRALFPENAFGDRCLEDVNLKILRDDSACPEACRVIQWIRGCFDALEKKYLRAVLVGIYEDPDDPDTVIEEYSFKFSYGNGAGLDIYRNGVQISTARSDAETKKATIRLLRTIVLLSQTLSPLPDDVMMTMKLLYYDDVTPEDYNPPGFKVISSHYFADDLKPVICPWENIGELTIRDILNAKFNQYGLNRFKISKFNFAAEEYISLIGWQDSIISKTSTTHKDCSLDNFNFKDEPMNIKVGDVSTQYHSFKLRIKTSHHDLQVADENDTVVPEPEEQYEDGNKTSLYLDTNDEEKPPNAVHQLSTRQSTPASSLVQDENIVQEVKCPCGVNEDDGLMILCASCNTWQHATCFAILKPDEAPDTHYCVDCSKNNGFNCTDQRLKDIDQVSSLKAVCLWRRTLVASLETTRILAPNLSKRLGVPIAMATSLLKRLEDEGFVTDGGKGKRFGKLVQKNEITELGFTKYFHINENKNRNEDIEMMTERASDLVITSKQVLSVANNNQIVITGSKRKHAVEEAVFFKNKDLRFEISNSQTSPISQQEFSAKKKRKASVSAEAMCV
uniref:HORMA domain-containing protein 1 n=1 Tax=Hydra vulgaris TaxID=6087 RepID=T2M9R3_HYDVU